MPGSGSYFGQKTNKQTKKSNNFDERKKKY